MSNKKMEKILFYDEAQKAWVVDMMEVDVQDRELINQGANENESNQEHSYA